MRGLTSDKMGATGRARVDVMLRTLGFAGQVELKVTVEARALLAVGCKYDALLHCAEILGARAVGRVAIIDLGRKGGHLNALEYAEVTLVVALVRRASETVAAASRCRFGDAEASVDERIGEAKASRPAHSLASRYRSSAAWVIGAVRRA